MRCFSFILLLGCVCSSLAGSDLPTYFPRCHRDNENAIIKDCLLEATETVRSYLSKGVKELEIPEMEHLILPLVTLEQGSQSMNFKIVLINASVDGLDKYVFKEFSFDPKTLKWKGLVTFESLKIEGDCDFDGKILVAPLHGKGTITIATGHTEGKIEVSGDLVKRGHKEYYNILDIDLKLSVTGGTVKFDNFADDNAELVKVINQVMQDNADEIIKEIASPLEKVASSIVRGIVEKTVKKVPYAKLFPLDNK